MKFPVRISSTFTVVGLGAPVGITTFAGVGTIACDNEEFPTCGEVELTALGRRESLCLSFRPPRVPTTSTKSTTAVNLRRDQCIPLRCRPRFGATIGCWACRARGTLDSGSGKPQLKQYFATPRLSVPHLRQCMEKGTPVKNLQLCADRWRGLYSAPQLLQLGSKSPYHGPLICIGAPNQWPLLTHHTSSSSTPLRIHGRSSQR